MVRKCVLVLSLLTLATGIFTLLGAGTGRADDRDDWRRAQNGPVRLLKSDCEVR